MWAMEEPAKRLCELLPTDEKLPREILKLDDATAGIVVDVDGVDYMLVMTRVPRQRQRPTEQ